MLCSRLLSCFRGAVLIRIDLQRALPRRRSERLRPPFVLDQRARGFGQNVKQAVLVHALGKGVILAPDRAVDDPWDGDFRKRLKIQPVRVAPERGVGGKAAVVETLGYGAVTEVGDAHEIVFRGKPLPEAARGRFAQEAVGLRAASLLPGDAIRVDRRVVGRGKGDHNDGDA